MYIYELPVDSQVNLEMTNGTSVYEVTTTVLGTSEQNKFEGQVLLHPIKYKGKILDLGNRRFEGIQFDLYADDLKGNRITWPNVSVSKKDYKNETFYVVKSNSHHPLSVSCDRRDNKRLVIDMPARISNIKLDYPEDVRVHDISIDGLSIISPKEIDIINSNTDMILYERMVSLHHEFNLQFRAIRKQDWDGQMLYGCKVSDTKNMMKIYSYFKNTLAMQALAQEKGTLH